MSLRHPFRAPRPLIALLALVTVGPSLLLIVLGIRMLQQDRALERQHAQLRREQAADLAVVALQQIVSDTERRLRDPPASEALLASPGAVFVAFEGEHVRVHPDGQVLYYPVVPARREASGAVFEDVDRLEHRDRDYLRAARLARQLARSPDPAVRAAAWIRVARNLARTRDLEGALGALNEAARVTDAAIAGVPADLFARWARCRLLEEDSHPERLREEARALYTDLLHGRWVLTRAQYELHLADAQAWAGADRPDERSAASAVFTTAVERLWTVSLRQGREEPAHGRDVLEIGGEPLTVLWVADRTRFAAVVARPGFVERQWLGELTSLLEPHHLRARLVHGPIGVEPASAVVRRASDTALPWALVVEPDDPNAVEAALASRERIWVAGLTSLLLLAAGGSWVVGRAVTRELALARLQSDFVAAVSHEFRTPLTTMAQLTESLLEGRAGDDRRQTYYEALARQTERLRRLVETLLDFGRMEAGGARYRRAAFAAAAWLDELVAQFQQEGASRGHVVHLQITGDAGLIHGDRDALTNAVWNLLDNATKYSPGAKDVWVDVHVEAAGGQVVIDVRDRGFGVPLREQRDIFQRFVRGARAKAENITGTGLGLAMVRQIVAAHGGDVRVSSRPGEGSTFTVRLPRLPSRSGDVPVGTRVRVTESCGAD